jgi:hypothetical protein
MFTGLGACIGAYAGIDDPMIRQHLLELAKTQDAMVASGNGNYRPLMAVLRDRPDTLRTVHKVPLIDGGGE